MTDHPGSVEAEATFFQHWSQQGVKTPQVLGIHSANTALPVSLSVLEYINAPTLEDAIDTQTRIQTGVSREMGVQLAKMHLAKGMGYGQPTNNFLVGHYSNLTTELEETLFGHRAAYLLQTGVITPADLEVARQAIKILENDLASGKSPSLTHGDYRPYNIMATQPLTIIDPNPRITHPALCLSISLLKAMVEGSEYGVQESKEVLAGYRETTTVDDPILSASLVLMSLRLMHTWSRKEKTKKVERIKVIMQQEGAKL